MKGLFDRCVAFVLLVLLAPVMLAVACAIRPSGPALFSQLRPGLKGRLFRLWKFRTMRPGAGSDAERLTPLGRFLRRSSLDELPQLWNVLRGDLSLVGPRPLLPGYLTRYSAFQARRHEVKPGITGWAQVNGRNAISWDERFALDVWYVDHRSFWLDLRILALTALRVVHGSGVSAQGHVTMPEFRG